MVACARGNQHAGANERHGVHMACGVGERSRPTDVCARERRREA